MFIAFGDIGPRYIPDYEELSLSVQCLKEKKLRIVLTQGVFDLLHIGHALYLEKAKEHGDILIVGVDSDELTRLRKGLNRPVVPQNERLYLLSMLRSVDILTIRDIHTDTDKLIKTVRPHVLIASETTKDFPPEKLATLKEYCGEIIRLPPQATTSTSARIRLLEIGGADVLVKQLTNRLPRIIAEIHEEMKNRKEA